MRTENWSVSKDDLYGPPPAYSAQNNYDCPPPSYTPPLYVVPIRNTECQDRLPHSHASIRLPKTFNRSLLAAGLINMFTGLASIVCDIVLTIMNESYSFTGLWMGALNIILGIDLIVFMSRQNIRLCALKRLRLIHITMCLALIVAIVLTSINLASDACYKIFLGPDRCQYYSHLIKIALLTLLSCTFMQLSTTVVLIFIHISKSQRLISRTNSTFPEIPN